MKHPEPETSALYEGEREVFKRLEKLEASPTQLKSARRRSYQNGSDIVRELVAAGQLCETEYFRQVAADLNLDFVEKVDPATLVLPQGHKTETMLNAGAVRCMAQNREGFVLSAPSQPNVSLMSRTLSRTPSLRGSFKITSRAQLEEALISRLSSGQIRETVDEMPLWLPEFSAKNVLTAKQGFVLGVALSALVMAFAMAFEFAMLFLHLAASLLFAGCVILRLRAASQIVPVTDKPLKDAEGPFPIYTVMVALYKEARVVPQLCSHLNKLNWPASRLELFFVCEEHDLETISAIETAKPNVGCRIITVPNYGPQTKPRALSYALSMARGEFVVIYDAEDRPHPDQLKEAYCRFQREPMRTACLQSPLVITNGAKSLIARMFAFEYAALFGGLLPYLARRSGFMPLGGTSNHFRRSVLMEAKAWDPYNVTEDADLGTRLVRLGYRTGMLSLPTLEDAPVRLAQWLPQRTRWFKGWIQTWFVHMRHPALLHRQLGFFNMIRFQVMTLGLFLSAIVYPFMIVEMSWQLSAIMTGGGYGLTSFAALIFAIDFANVALGHLGFYLLGLRARPGAGMLGNLMVLLSLPAYWTLMAVAALRAVWQLFRTPHYWEKTEHFPSD